MELIAKIQLTARLVTYASWLVTGTPCEGGLRFSFQIDGDFDTPMEALFDVEEVGRAFLSLENTDQVSAFLQKYGPLGPLRLGGGAGRFQEAIAEASVTSQWVLDSVRSWRAYLSAGSFAGTKREPHPLAEEKDVTEQQRAEFYEVIDDEQSRACLTPDVTVQLGKYRPRLKGVATVFDVETAMASLAIMLRASRRKLRACHSCKVFFLPRTSRTSTCSARCRSRQTTANFRKRQRVAG